MSRVHLYSRDTAQFKHRCSYNDKGNGGSRHSCGSRAVDNDDLEHIKRKRVKCPQCGRRLWGWATIGHDGDFYHYAVPAHKTKKWWKKGKSNVTNQRRTKQHNARSVRQRSKRV